LRSALARRHDDNDVVIWAVGASKANLLVVRRLQRRKYQRLCPLTALRPNGRSQLEWTQSVEENWHLRRLVVSSCRCAADLSAVALAEAEGRSAPKAP
jgi:hypothetical protein